MSHIYYYFKLNLAFLYSYFVRIKLRYSQLHVTSFSHPVLQIWLALQIHFFHLIVFDKDVSLKLKKWKSFSKGDLNCIHRTKRKLIVFTKLWLICHLDWYWGSYDYLCVEFIYKSIRSSLEQLPTKKAQK